MAPAALAAAAPATPQPLRILWRDARVVAVYKPAGWLVHRSALDAHETRWVVQTLRDQIGQPVYPVHRLDKGTCGVLLLALDADAARQLGQAFMEGRIHKRYLALVRGWPEWDAQPHRIDHPLRPDDAPPTAAAQPASTVLHRRATLAWPEAFDARFADTRIALVQAQPLTGRRHQIRRHLKHAAHPIIGDATHGKGPLNRWWAERLGLQQLWLHAWSIGFAHPEDGRPIEVHSGLTLEGSTPEGEAHRACTHDWRRLMALPWQHEAQRRDKPEPRRGQ